MRAMIPAEISPQSSYSMLLKLRRKPTKTTLSKLAQSGKCSQGACVDVAFGLQAELRPAFVVRYRGALEKR